ncbi:nucleotide-diphospho-sugar transferase [Metschnikowia bicuspidata var. bicuspidata NRRL YB-4993]|uniref:Nucleotide-diphospho-sugar transferase n=1 Tax=Metschnikowia bicuspidata var. bicuspidata NRRL YB-4993 TaxID=869754 RepID=A0A1A0HA79_9ASCO|nr:nucleotide-diphospho-sugar transferase [Metschnikowia bicuspidata var. bicuspidata NRRL YB-4993]OBA20782.1 nucleotide-diphospho-sugar transferase [Metschnikowia bicuspidata var. bicuspidata NRRL YB-4993]
MKNIDEHKPSVNGINNDEHYRQSKDENRYVNRDGRIPVYGGHLREQYLNEPVRSFEYLKSFLRLSEDETSSLKNSHEKYMLAMKTSIPEQILKKGLQFGFMKGDGIVYLGGAKYDQLVLTSVSVLRSLGSKIPVEVIVPKRSDYNIDLCNIILPQLNGKCRVMEDFVPASVMLRIGGFQLKNVALLVSSFKNVLYLDADNVPVKNPDVLFVNEPFKSLRMVMWPDLWRRSTSPLFYEIAGIEVDKTHHARNSYFKGDGRGESSDPALISFHDLKGALPEASSETGQMMIDKEKHFPTLVLSMYYNFYGPDYFYPLFSQGAAGEGDKETFIAAAHKLGLPYYQVGEFNREFGPMGKNQKREYFGMGQYDPIIDHFQSTMPDRSSRAQTEYALDQEDDTKSNYDFHMYKSHSLMFLHANWPKFYLDELFEKNGFGRGPKDGQNKRRRLYSEHMIKETGGFDAELHIMRHIKQWACDARIELANVPGVGSDRRKKICEEVAGQIKFLAGA